MYIYVFVLTYYVNMSQRDTLHSLGVMDETVRQKQNMPSGLLCMKILCIAVKSM